MKAHIAKVRGDAAKERTHVGLRHELAGKRGEQIVTRPAEHHRIADGQRKRAQRRNETDDLADEATLPDAAHLHGLAKRAHGAGSHGTPKRHLANHAREPKQRHEDEVRDEKRRTAELSDAVGEEPDIGHADSASHAGKDEARARCPGIALASLLRRAARLLADLDRAGLFLDDVIALVCHDVSSSQAPIIAKRGECGRVDAANIPCVCPDLRLARL